MEEQAEQKREGKTLDEVIELFHENQSIASQES
jgi:hypothetical protein